MKKLKIVAILLVAIQISSCNGYDDDGYVNSDNKSLSYNLNQVNSSGISGNARFIELENGDIQLKLTLNNLEAEANHPAHIHYNSADESGDVYVALENVSGSTNKSITVFNQDIEGNPLNYNNLSTLDAHINVHLSPEDLQVIAQGNIGNNASSSGGGGGY
ncbi:MAG: hypothetical protein ABR595_10135 [Psychroflexus sp.]